MTPTVNKTAASSPTIQSARPATVVFRPAKKPAPTIQRADPHDEFLKEMKKPAQTYFSKVGLRMTVPDGFAFAEEGDGPVQVLIGASEPGKSDFYFFSVKGKYGVDKVNGYLKQYFADEMTITPKGSPQSFYSKGGFGDMTQLRGGTNRGEYQAYFFTNGKSNHSHLVMLMNRNLIKSPARVRELIDSISRASR